MFDTFYKSAFYQQVKGNRRLQWMIFAIFIILSLSVTKAVFDITSELISDNASKAKAVSKLSETLNRPLTDDMLENAESVILELVSSAPLAELKSIAEAEALKAINSIADKRVFRSQARLIGSQEISYGKQNFWQVRVQISGNMRESDLIGILESFDGSNSFIRLQTLEFRPEARGAFSMVVDFLYKQGQLNENS